MILKVKKLSKKAKLPKFAHADDAGIDVFSLEKAKILPGHKKNISTGISMEIPVGYAGLIWDKGSLANQALHTIAGVIDAGYRGDIVILIVNLSQNEIIIEEGQKIAQILIQKIERPELIQMSELSKSTRENNGFGSTGKF